MYFKYESTVRNLLLKLEEAEAIRFDYGGSHKISVEIRLPDAEEQKIGLITDNPICTTSCQRNPNVLIASMFDSLAQGKLPEGSAIPKPSEWFGDHVDAQGYVEENYVIPSQFLPQPFQDFTDDVIKELSDHARRTVSGLRWRYNASGPHNPLGSGSNQWSMDGIKWLPMPFRGSVYVSANKLLTVDDSTRQDIERTVKNGGAEPLGHELFREAKAHQPQNPRSALVLALVAAETGIKQCISTLAPDSRWLIENSPSPDLVKLIKEYLPTLTPKQGIYGKAWPLPNEDLAVLKKCVAARNRIVHGRTTNYSADNNVVLFPIINDLLFLCDYSQGWSWALEHVRGSTKAKLEAS